MQEIFKKIVRHLQDVDGLLGIVLGGSRATNTHTADSDIDIGLYYDSRTLSLEQLQKAATLLDDAHRDKPMTAIGEWGKGVNGGGWLQIDGIKVDLLYRDLEVVKAAIAEAKQGEIQFYYQTGHPHAFLNLMYVGEIHYCKILWQKAEMIQQVKETIQIYPEKLRQAALGYFGFEMEFSLMFMEKQLGNQDVHYLMGHAFRSISCLVQYLYALNSEYCLNEKKAVKNVSRFAKVPEDFSECVKQIYQSLSDSRMQRLAVADLRQLILGAKRMDKSESAGK